MSETKPGMSSWTKEDIKKIVRHEIINIGYELANSEEGISECELCDGPISEVAVCLSCWNEMAPKVNELERQIKIAKVALRMLNDAFKDLPQDIQSEPSESQSNEEEQAYQTEFHPMD